MRYVLFYLVSDSLFPILTSSFCNAVSFCKMAILAQSGKSGTEGSDGFLAGGNRKSKFLSKFGEDVSSSILEIDSEFCKGISVEW